jgi:hypothetical protein
MLDSSRNKSIVLDELSLNPRPRAAVVVAHPDDETLWCGGYILTHPEFLWRIVTLCRRMDADRATKFRQVVERLGADGEMADLDDGPDQAPLPVEQVEETTAGLLAGNSYDLILTHGPHGEYTQQSSLSPGLSVIPRRAGVGDLDLAGMRPHSQLAWVRLHAQHRWNTVLPTRRRPSFWRLIK